MVTEITIKAFHCKQCGHTWVPRKSIIKKCPRCQSPRWNQKREGAAR